MKLRSPLFIFAIVIIAILGVIESAFSDPLIWDTGYGTVDLRLQSSESVVGYDGVLKQAIAGIALPVYTDPKGIVTLHLGAGAPWPVGNQSTIQPIVMLGHNLLKEIPGLSQYSNIQLNAFGRWATNRGEAGAGIALSYAFATPASQTLAQPSVAVTPVVVTPPVVAPAQPEVVPSTPTAPAQPQPNDEPSLENLPLQ